MTGFSELGRAVSLRGKHMREETNRKISRAALEIALSEGVKAVTIEEVARRSGVAKTTIYRRFRNTSELLKSISLLNIDVPVEVENLEPTLANLELLIATAVSFFDESVGVKSVGMILSSDTDFFHQIFERVIVPIKNRVSEFFESGIEIKVFKPETDVNFVLEQVLGGMVVTAAINGSVPEKWPKQMARFLWTNIAVK